MLGTFVYGAFEVSSSTTSGAGYSLYIQIHFWSQDIEQEMSDQLRVFPIAVSTDQYQHLFLLLPILPFFDGSIVISWSKSFNKVLNFLLNLPKWIMINIVYDLKIRFGIQIILCQIILHLNLYRVL